MMTDDDWWWLMMIADEGWYLTLRLGVFWWLLTTYVHCRCRQDPQCTHGDVVGFWQQLSRLLRAPIPTSSDLPLAAFCAWPLPTPPPPLPFCSIEHRSWRNTELQLTSRRDRVRRRGRRGRNYLKPNRLTSSVQWTCHVEQGITIFWYINYLSVQAHAHTHCTACKCDYSQWMLLHVICTLMHAYIFIIIMYSSTYIILYYLKLL